MERKERTATDEAGAKQNALTVFEVKNLFSSMPGMSRLKKSKVVANARENMGSYF